MFHGTKILFHTVRDLSMEQKYCSMEQKYCSILYARAYPILTVADGSEQLAGWHSRSGSGNLCHGDRSRTGSYPLWVGNRFSIGPEPDEASRVPARGSESLLSAAGEPQPTSHAQQQRALSLPHSPHYHSLRKLPTLLSLIGCVRVRFV